MDIAKRLHVQSQDPDADLGDVATKFARVARAVRQTIALESRLAETERYHAEQAAAAAANTHDGAPRSFEPPDWVKRMGIDRAEAHRREAERKLEAVSLVRRAIRGATGFDREALELALDERLDLDRSDDGFDDRTDPVATIQSICAGLGLDPDWGGLSELDWRRVRRETRAGLTGAAIETLPSSPDLCSQDVRYPRPVPGLRLVAAGGQGRRRLAAPAQGARPQPADLR